MPKTSLEGLRHRAQQQLALALESASADDTLLDAMRYSVLGGGKRLRPLLVYASTHACSGSLDDADAAAIAVELIHAYSLVHDDLPALDNDDLRRGKPTTHRQFGEATAILVGDALQALAFNLLARSTNADRLTQIELLSDAAGARGMVAGQMIDLASTGRTISAEALEHMHRLKTGALIQASVLMGCCGGPVPRSTVESLGEFATCLGLAFQVKDDLLDVTGDTLTLGKRQGADQALDKRTYVSVHGVEGATAILEDLYGRCCDLLDRMGSQTQLLRELADLVVSRDH